MGRSSCTRKSCRYRRGMSRLIPTIGLSVLLFSGCSLRLRDERAMEHIAQQSLDIREMAGAIELGADPVVWSKEIQMRADTILDLTEFEEADRDR